MAEIKISQLQVATALTGDEAVEVVQGGQNRRTTTQAIADLVPPASASTAGTMSPADKAKLDGIEAGATANASDAYLLARANHTGTQAIGTVAGLQDALDSKADAVHNHQASSVTDFNTAVYAKVKQILQQGSNVILTSNDGTEQISVASTGGGPGGGGANWGEIGGTLSSQTDLMSALNAKAEASHGHPQATTSTPGFMSADDKLKLDGIAVGATANSPDATLLNRANHTGTQAISTVAGLQDALDSKAPANITVESVAAASYTLVPADNGKIKVFTSSSPVAITVPAGLGAGFSCTLVQGGTGTLTLGAGAGATVDSLGGSLSTDGQKSAVSLLPTGTDAYLAVGALGSFVEAVYTALKSIIVDGSNVTTTENDTAKTITISAAGGGGGIADGDKGDITVSGSGATWTIDADAVNNAKLANMGSGTLKGRISAGTGDPEDLTPAQVRTLLNVADGATANASDTYLLNRANHSGTQAISTVAGLQDALDSKAPAALSVNTQTGANYTLQLTDRNSVVNRNSGSSNTTTVPPNSAVAFPVGSTVVIHQLGTGASSIVAGAGVTIRKRANRNLTLSGQYALATLVKIGTDEWVCSGDLEAV
ncbi:hypothetical protein [Caldimonas thermodepolymerans]|jgi:hypothetical protein|uniref:hypothetical protein n=1 Tax=Caldimonas thermodepolymerans TaxID=215580 RepID=UPI0024924191|nr:hypothetical protein [Caldimonas thermodepolymerans]